MSEQGEEIFKHVDEDGDKMEVDEFAGKLIVSNYQASEGDTVGVRLDPAHVNDLHSALGAWMAAKGITARAAVQPEADGVTFSGLAARVTEMERRQAASHGSLSASLGQDADKIGNLTHAVNRAHRRIDGWGQVRRADHDRLTRLEESDVSTVPDLANRASQQGAAIDELKRRVGVVEATQRGASQEFDEKDAAEEIGEIIKGLAYLRAAVDSMHEDLFRQASGLATSAQLSRNGTHEALAGLLTEIRDRLPAPPPPRCNDLAPDGHSQCDLPEDHTGRHAQGTSSWPQICGEPSPYNIDETCQVPAGHRGDHRAGRKVWEPF